VDSYRDSGANPKKPVPSQTDKKQKADAKEKDKADSDEDDDENEDKEKKEAKKESKPQSSAQPSRLERAVQTRLHNQQMLLRLNSEVRDYQAKEWGCTFKVNDGLLSAYFLCFMIEKKLPNRNCGPKFGHIGELRWLDIVVSFDSMILVS
jgi:hypothetical protein